MSAKEKNRRKKRTPQLVYTAAVSFYAFDRIFKWIALSGAELAPDGWLSFDLYRNTGIAFSIPFPNVLFWAIVLPVFAGLSAWFMRDRTRDPLVASVLFLVIAGAVSNIIDRIRYSATIDYILLFQTSAINLADFMIIGGIITLLVMKKSGGSRRKKT